MTADTGKPPARTLPSMHTPQLPPYVLESGGAFTPDPDNCSHCAHSPGYAHRHWRQGKPPALSRGEPNLFWRAMFRIYGDGGR